MRTWSKYQLAVFENVANGTGHTVVDAVAGSGKTTTIEEAVKHVPAGKRTLFVAFNKPIATELAKRLGGAPGVEVSTLHSYGLRCVSAALGRLRIDQYRVPNFIEAMHGSDSKTFDMRRDLAKIVSLAKGSLVGTEEGIDALIDAFGADSVNGNRPQFVKDVLKVLEQCTGTQDGCLDFDDMIWLPVVLDLPQRKFDRVFVDETQDLNAAQIEMVLRAVKADGRILAVGDPRQAIYRFRGADENAFGNVQARMNAVKLDLSVCYRCCKAVIREAQELVPHIEAAPDAEEGEVLRTSYAQMKKDAKAGDFILSRTNAPLISLCMAFLKEGRRANIQGRDVGASLAAFVKKSKAKTVEALRSYVEEWAGKECARLAAKRRDTQAIEDRAACILALSEGAVSVEDVVANILSLFADKDEQAIIMLSSTHKAKGLERDRVWVLRATYLRRDESEERNLLYVAQTRARKTLVLVKDLGKDDDE